MTRSNVIPNSSTADDNVVYDVTAHYNPHAELIQRNGKRKTAELQRAQAAP